ncbi:hypothetical protein C2G38_1137494 [Gigaspora rosea]|uniref:Uncharacterized protein n=1 Tax=Gigaspora rosea TaxID=44941 RepID=A0A397VF03_9GLOM|nr:hypothetical protein C2G38_1137494 [Gigaspora rosea]
MKLFNLSYNLITQCLFLISLCAFITSTKSELTFFNYTEKTLNEPNVPNQKPFVIKLATYDDGTTLVHITRWDKNLNTNCTNYLGILAGGLEQILRIRVIQLNGTVIEINLDFKLDPPNYCYGRALPVRIYALQKPFILVNYLNATNPFDPATYEECGSVIDWNGNIKSNIRFGLSFVQFNRLFLSSEIHLNVNNKLGFLRLAFEGKSSSYSYGWQQYIVDDSGVVTMLKSATIPTDNVGISIIVTGMATIDGGYAIIYANSTNEITTNNSFTISGKVYAVFISYNRTDEYRTILLYTLNNYVNFTGIYCDIVAIGVGQVCTIAAKFNFYSNGTVNNFTEQYIRIYFLSSGSLLKVDETSSLNLPNITVAKSGWQATSMLFGGYILHAGSTDHTNYYVYAYDEFNLPRPLVSTISSNETAPINNFTTNIFGAYTIMKNNTLLLPTRDTNVQNTSWSLYSILLPKVLESRDHGFGNLEINQVFPPINGSVDSSYITINITFFNPVMLSNDPRPGYLTIYKTSDTNNFRQKIPPTPDYCQISLDGLTISIYILPSTFNEYNESYYVRMDNNFVKSRIYREPLNGINDRIWNLTSNNKHNLIAGYNSSGYAIVGLASITNDAKSKFLSFSRSERSSYFAQLLNKTAEKVPVRRTRLSTDEKFQYINYGKSNEQIIFSIKIDLPIDLNDNTADSVVSDLNTMIIKKQITNFSTGITNDLDNSFGFVILDDFWTTNLTLIIVSIIILVTIMYLYAFSYKPLCHLDPKIVEIVHIYTSYAIIAINFFFMTYFVFINTRDKPELFLPSVIIWSIQIGINLIMCCNAGDI